MSTLIHWSCLLVMLLLWPAAAGARPETPQQAQKGVRDLENDPLPPLPPPPPLRPGSPQTPPDAPGARPPQADEPGIGTPAPQAPKGFWSRRDSGPRMKFGYRTFAISEMGGRPARFHLFSVDRYFISGIFRAAGGIEGGYAPSSLNYLYFGAALSAGVQYPCRLTPFVDLVTSFGLARREAFHQNLFGFSFHLGLEVGVELYVLERLLLSVAMGWRRPAIYHPGNDELAGAYLYYDVFSLKIGLGF